MMVASVPHRGDPPLASFKREHAGNTIAGDDLKAGLASMCLSVPPAFVDRPRTGPRRNLSPGVIVAEFDRRRRKQTSTIDLHGFTRLIHHLDRSWRSDHPRG